MRGGWLAGIAFGWLAAAAQCAQDEPAAAALFPGRYANYETMAGVLRGVAEAHPDRARLTSLAKTIEGREVWLVELGPESKEGEPARPAILIVANLEADHLVGSEVAVGLVRRLAESEDEASDALLASCRVYVVPRLDPDGAERALTAPQRANLRPVDADRDGKLDEDGPDDLDGDGVIARMRRKDDDATLVPDEKEPRRLRKAEAAKGERPVYSEYAEGLDDDGDEQFNEDGPGGVNLNRNWPQGWTEFDAEAGYSPASEPEVHALIAFCYEHPEIAAVWTIGLNDNLRQTPKNPGAKLDDADLPQFVELSEAYAKLLAPPPEAGGEGEAPAEPADRREGEAPAEPSEPKEEAEKKAEPEAKVEDKDEKKDKAPPAPLGGSALGATTDGAMSEWAYRQFGAMAISTSIWPEPKLPEPKDGQPKPPDDAEGKWLWWNDHVVGGAAFVPFHEVDHPELGKIEIGGWRPSVRINPPHAEVEALIDPHVGLLKELGSRLARLEIGEPEVEDRGGGVFEVTAVVSNAGTWPTALAQGVTTRQADPVRVRIALDGAKLLAGPLLDRVPTLGGSGGKKEYRWLLLRERDDATATISAECPRAGRAERGVEWE